MNKNRKRVWAFVVAIILVLLARLAIYLGNTNIPILEPRGYIADKERELMFVALGLSLIVVIPVFTMLFMIAWRYREGNAKAAKYSPDFDHSRVAETVWWLIPSAIIVVLSVITWNSSHSLDPYRPIDSKTPAIHIQVVALDWKWLFIYPQQKIATVNYFNIPKNTPIDLDITSDAPMNSFWLPQLAGQIYAMPGMSTQLHIMASGIGNYSGSSANISGSGFANMTFTAHVQSASNFTHWVVTAQRQPQRLSVSAYRQLAKPTQNRWPLAYSRPVSGLYNWVVEKYMMPNVPAPGTASANHGMSSLQNMSGMGM